MLLESDRVNEFWVRDGVQGVFGVRDQPAILLCHLSSDVNVLKDLGSKDSITAQGIRFLNGGASRAAGHEWRSLVLVILSDPFLQHSTFHYQGTLLERPFFDVGARN